MASKSFWTRAIIHVDMDAFYASVEQLDNPELRGKPIIVAGSPEERGVVSAASYEVRPYGVRSAMPTSKAMRLCPHAIRVQPRMHRYEEVSEMIFDIFHRVTPLVQGVSLDEAFLDVTGCQRLHGDPVSIARRIKLTIKKESNLTASVGVASTRFAAKIASDLKKPDGLMIVPADKTLEILGPLQVSRIWGVGPAMAKHLEKLGIKTIGQLREWPLSALVDKLGNSGQDLYNLAHGIDNSEVIPDEKEKSISHECTFSKDVSDVSILEMTLLEQADKVATRLRERNLSGRVVFIKLRYDDFSTVTRRRTIPTPTNIGDVIHHNACELMRQRTEAGSRPVRLIGVGVGGFGPIEQGELFSTSLADPRRMERRENTADLIRRKIGDNAIQRASIYFNHPNKKSE